MYKAGLFSLALLVVFAVLPIQAFDLVHRFGYAVSGGTDLDGDEFPDIVIGAPNYDLYVKPNAGRVYIYSGVNGELIAILEGESSGDRFGWAVACAGDITGDGTNDIVVGAPFYDDGGETDAGKVYVYSLVSDHCTLHFTKTGPNGSDQLGRSVVNLGDMNKDDTCDFIVSAPGWNSGKGFTRVYWGGDTLKLGWFDEGQFEGDSAGIGLAGGCDINNDDTVDYVVGSPYFEVLGTDKGRIYVMDGADGEMLWLSAKTGTYANELFGYSIGLADINGDDLCDVLVGAPGYSSSKGRVYLYNASTKLLFTSEGTIEGDNSGDEFGYAVAGCGNMCGSGSDADFIVGIPGANADSGKVTWFKRDGIYTTSCYTVFGYSTSDELGRSVACVGDLDDDDLADLVAGAPKASAYSTGAAYAYSAAEAELIYEFGPNDCDCLIGDANGDGAVNVGDAVYIINCVFKGGPCPERLCNWDANGDCAGNIGDAVYILAYVFNGGPPPPSCVEWLCSCVGLLY